MDEYRTCPNVDCANHENLYEADEENNYCPRCGQKLIDFTPVFYKNDLEN